MRAAAVAALASLVAILAVAATAHAELPALQPYHVGNMSSLIVKTINCSASFANGTIIVKTSNTSGLVLLSPLFGYAIEGNGSAGVAAANGTVYVSFNLSNGPVIIEGSEVFHGGNKTLAARGNATVYPVLIVAANRTAVFKVVPLLLPQAQQELSAPQPPFSGTIWQGHAEPALGGGHYIAARHIGYCSNLRVAFWEPHTYQDEDLYIYRNGYLAGWIFSDDGHWHERTFGAGDYTLKIHQYAVFSTHAEQWMVVYQCGSTHTQTQTQQPHSSAQQGAQQSQSRGHTSGGSDTHNNYTIYAAAAAGFAIFLALVALAASAGRR